MTANKILYNEVIRLFREALTAKRPPLLFIENLTIYEKMDGGINSHVPDDRLKKILDELFIRAKLSKREKFILEQHFYNEYRFFEIAKMMNIS